MFRGNWYLICGGVACVRFPTSAVTSKLEKYDSFEGFVVLHDEDSMAYTASALSFCFENLGKPIIITGIQEVRYVPVNVELADEILVIYIIKL